MQKMQRILYMYRPTFIEVSHNVSVEVKPRYLEGESSPAAQKHVFAYVITLRNRSTQPVQLHKRHWLVEDSGGENYEVDGEGVIGSKPVIEPNGHHTYNSFCVLKSYRGKMRGYYLMECEDGTSIKVTIPEFLLTPHTLN